VFAELLRVYHGPGTPTTGDNPAFFPHPRRSVRPAHPPG